MHQHNAMPQQAGPGQGQFYGAAPPPQNNGQQQVERQQVADINSTLGSTSPVSPHLQQNGFANQQQPVANVSTGGGQTATPASGQAFTGAGGTWTGANTLTYTQSMQPPENRNHHNNYCKFFHLFTCF